MEIDRRRALGLLAGAAAGPVLSGPAGAAPAGRVFLGARNDGAGTPRASGILASGAPVFDLPLPGRGHSFAVHPSRAAAVVFARRPGRFARAIDLVRGAVGGGFSAPGNRHFYGHGVFARGGRLLYATENDFEGGRGVIGVYDAEDGYRRVGEFPSHGIGPHDIRLLSDGRTLAVANGGIRTRPDLPRVALNLPTMRPSLCFVDRTDGTLLQECRLDDAYSRLSIRHLAVGGGDVVAVAMQYKGPAGDLVPLVALWCGGRLRPLHGPPPVVRAMRQYCGSVCFDSRSSIMAVSHPRGHLVTFWDAGTGAWLSSARIEDGSGVAPADEPGKVLASSGKGGVSIVDARSGRAAALEGPFPVAGRWDNHLVAVEA